MSMALIIVMIASVIVSASHTILAVVKTPTIVGYVVGFSFFIMVELAIIIFAFFTTRMTTINSKDTVKRLTTKVMFFVLAIAIGANIHEVLQQNGFAIVTGDGAIAWKLFDFGLSLLVALSAPVVAFVTGEVLAILHVYNAGMQSRLDAEHDKAMEAWRQSANTKWAHEKRNYGAVIRVESVPVAMLTDDNSANLIKNNGLTRQKPSVRLDTALAYLREHPEALTIAPRKLEEVVGVGYGTIHKAQVMLRSEVES